MRIRNIAIFILFPIFANAQAERLINHKDVIWAAKVEAVVGFDRVQAPLPPHLLEIVPVKVVQDNPEAPHPSPFTDHLNRLIERGALPAYADRGLTASLPPGEARARLIAADTIVVFDPETYEETVQVVSYDLLGETPFFVVQQLWLFNGRKNELETIALAIAPAVKSGSQPDRYQPLVWYKLPAPRRGLSRLKSPAVRFATHIRYSVSEEQIEVLKGKDKHLKEILVERLQAGTLMGYDQKRQPIPPSAIDDIFVQQDTIITFDPETYEEHVQMVRLEFGPIDITDFSVQQNWFFAPSRNSLQCSPLAAGPAIPVIDEYGKQQALRPLFFWRRE